MTGMGTKDTLVRHSLTFCKSLTTHAREAGKPRGGGSRGAYYKNKYGGGGRGRSDNHHANGSEPAGTTRHAGPRDWDQLHRDLKSIDGQQYGKQVTFSRNHNPEVSNGDDVASSDCRTACDGLSD